MAAHAELEGLWRRLRPLVTLDMAADLPPPRDSRFGSPLTLSRVHWVRPELVAEVKYLTWTEDNLLRQVVYEGLREARPPFTAAPFWGQQRASRWRLIGRFEDRTCCNIVTIWRLSAVDLIARNDWTPRRNFAV